MSRSNKTQGAAAAAAGTVSACARHVRRSAIGMLIVVTAVACSKPQASRLDEPSIRRFVQAGAQAAARYDANTLCAQLAEDAEIRLVEVRFSSSDVQRFDKAQWCEYLRRAYAAVPPGMLSQSAVDITSVEIAADGKNAEVTMEVTESVSMAGHEITQTSRQGATIALIEGRPRYTRVTARVAAAR